MQSDSDLEGFGLMQSDDTTIESDAGDNDRESLDSDTYDPGRNLTASGRSFPDLTSTHLCSLSS